MLAAAVTTTAGEMIPCDRIITCVGFEKNEQVRSLLGSSTMHANGLV